MYICSLSIFQFRLVWE